MDITHLQKIQLEMKPTNFADIADSTNMTDYFNYEGFMAMNKDHNDPWASINWDTHTIPAITHYETIIANTAVIPTISANDTCIFSLVEKPFYIDLGATVRISLCISNFVTLQLIPPWAVKGVTSIQAIGIGQICLQVQNQTEICLKNAFYIPNSTVHLISILVLAIGMSTTITFSRTGVTILNKSSGTLLAASPLILGQHIYKLELQSAWHLAVAPWRCLSP